MTLIIGIDPRPNAKEGPTEPLGARRASPPICSAQPHRTIGTRSCPFARQFTRELIAICTARAVRIRQRTLGEHFREDPHLLFRRSVALKLGVQLFIKSLGRGTGLSQLPFFPPTSRTTDPDRQAPAATHAD